MIYSDRLASAKIIRINEGRDAARSDFQQHPLHEEVYALYLAPQVQISVCGINLRRLFLLG